LPGDLGLAIAAPLQPRTKQARILLVSHVAELGGAEMGLLDIAAHFGPSRCDVLLFADGPLRPLLEARGITVKLLDAGQTILGVRRQGGVRGVLHALPATLSVASRVARIAKPYDLIYANSQKAALTTMLARAFGGRRVVWHLHDIMSAAHFGWLQRRLVSTLSNHLACKVIVVSAAARAALIKAGGTASRIAVIHNGIDPAPYRNLPEMARASLREKHDLPAGRLVGLFGRITPWKGQRVLIQALPLLPDTHALIVGTPMFGEDAELAHLHTLAAELGVADRVYFLGYRSDAPELMRAADLVVHCSTSPEPFGRVIVEALLAGTPVLAAEGGASREILGDTPSWLVRPDDPAALASAIRTFFATDEQTRSTRTQDMRAHIGQRFSVSRMVAAIDDLVIQLAC
jgi:glycosyltransferase involved in cell wall biosynthesis